MELKGYSPGDDAEPVSVSRVEISSRSGVGAELIPKVNGSMHVRLSWRVSDPSEEVEVKLWAQNVSGSSRAEVRLPVKA